MALVEVQAYAYEAAVRGAALLAAYGERAGGRARAWAEDLRSRFGPAYWVETPDGGHSPSRSTAPARRRGSLTSNIGHLLGTGVLDPAQVDRVAALLAEPRMDAGSGLRTLADDAPRFSRLSYHGGAVWPHDTAIAVRGLAAEGHHDAAAQLAAGLFRAAEGFGYRLPELYGGDAADACPRPTRPRAARRPGRRPHRSPRWSPWPACGSRATWSGTRRAPARPSARGRCTGCGWGSRPSTCTWRRDGTVRVDVANTTLRSEVLAE